MYDSSASKLLDTPQPSASRTVLHGDSANFLSDQFSWLPTDFAISPDGSSARALAYINNLSRAEYPALYPVIERLVARFVPLWERVLGETRMGEQYNLPSRIGADAQHQGYEWVPRDRFAKSGLALGGWGDGGKFDLALPSITFPFKPYKIPPPVNLRGRNIQVIVKLANIHLVSKFKCSSCSPLTWLRPQKIRPTRADRGTSKEC